MLKKLNVIQIKKSLENLVKDKVSSSELVITKGEIELVFSNKVDKIDLKTKLDLQKVLIGDADIQIKKLETKIDTKKTGDVPTKVINEYKFIAGRKYFILVVTIVIKTNLFIHQYCQQLKEMIMIKLKNGCLLEKIIHLSCHIKNFNQLWLTLPFILMVII